MCLKERLILAGIDIIEKEGITGFTIRNVAAACNVSCAAPYKHFKDKEEMLTAVIDYVNDKWLAVQKNIQVEDENDVCEILIQASIAFIRFFTENPKCRAVIMLMNEDIELSTKYKNVFLNGYLRELQSKWYQKSNYTFEQISRKTYIERSLVIGATIMFQTGELEYNEENMQMIEKCIRREFELD